jgi:endonuclease/exonuclease/phosphatase family metal-dependent hydrolase
VSAVRIGILTRRRVLPGHGEVREPTVLALALTAIAVVALAVVCVAGIAFVPAFGHVWWTVTAVGAVLGWLLLGLRRRRRRRPDGEQPAWRQRWFRRTVGLARVLFVGLLACWLGLIAWAAFCPGGTPPPPKADPALIRVITWNIHCGQDEGPPWKQFDWPVRKHALRAALDQARPDILCVQEATPEQVAFLEKVLPGHRRVGVGRDDGKAGGEHCAIYFNRKRFEEVGGSTFWLEEPTDQPRAGSALDVKRICTWVRLRDRARRRTLRVYNTHLYLTEGPSLTAAQIILAHVAAGDPGDAVLLTADFNASPSAPSRRQFIEFGLADSAARAGLPAGRPTFQLYGIGLWCIDGILVDQHWRVHNHLILDVKPQNTFPSDHFGLLADLGLPE